MTAHKKKEQPNIEQRIADAKALFSAIRAARASGYIPTRRELWRESGYIRPRRERRHMLGLQPDIDRQVIAISVLFGEPLEGYEREFAARLIDSDVVTLLIGGEPRKKGHPASTEAAVKRDEIAESYFFYKAMHPHAKHKEEIRPAIAKQFGVSASYVDKILGKLDPARRREMKSAAADFAEGLRRALRN
jgi:hypothetical protein